MLANITHVLNNPITGREVLYQSVIGESLNHIETEIMRYRESLTDTQALNYITYRIRVGGELLNR